MQLAKAAFKGVSWSAGATILKACLQVAQVIVVARFLSHAELGVMAIVGLVVGFVVIFGEGGLSSAIIYHRDLKREQLGQLYFLNLLLGLGVTLLVCLLAMPLQAFFSMPALAELLWLLSPSFFIRSIGQQAQAHMRQELRFNVLAIIEVTAASCAFLLLLWLLFFTDLRLASIVISQLLGTSIIAVGALLAAREQMSLRFYVKYAEISHVVKYGLYQTGEACINYFSAQFDQLLIGKFFDASILGSYSYVKSLAGRPSLQLINPVVQNVTFPLMVKYRDSHNLANVYCNIIRLLALINLPLYLIMAVYPASLLVFVLGDSWSEYADLLRWLAIYLLLISLINPVGALMRATGAVRRAFWWNVFVTAVRPLVLLGTFRFGVIGMVQSLVFLQVLLFIGHWYWLLAPVANICRWALANSFWPAIWRFFSILALVKCLAILGVVANAYLEIALITVLYMLALVPVAKQILISVKQV